MDLLSEFYCRSIILGNQCTGFSTVSPNSILFPVQQNLTANNKFHAGLTLSSNVIKPLPLNFDTKSFNNTQANNTFLVVPSASSLSNKSMIESVLPSLSTLISNNASSLMNETIKNSTNQITSSFLQQEQLQRQELITTQNWASNFLSLFDQTRGFVEQQSNYNRINNSTSTDVKLSTIATPFFQATTMKHSTLSTPNDNNNLSLPFNVTTATTMIQALSTVSSMNSAIGNLDRFSPSSISCASIDSGFSDSSYQPESPESSSSAVVTNTTGLSHEKENNKNVIDCTSTTLQSAKCSSPNTFKKTHEEEFKLKNIEKVQKKRSPPKRLFSSIESMIDKNYLNSYDENNNFLPPIKVAKIMSNNSIVSEALQKPALVVENLKVNTPRDLSIVIKSEIKEISNVNILKPLPTSKYLVEEKYSSKASTSSELFCYNNNKSYIDDVNTIDENVVTKKEVGIKQVENVKSFLECGCFWANCELRFSTDNELYDHVVQAN